MNILFICSKPPYPPKDGGTIATWSHIRGMMEIGHDVSVLYMNTYKHKTEIEKIPKEYREKILWHSVHMNTSINFLSVVKNIFFSKMSYIASRFCSLAFGRTLEKMLNGKKYDMVQVEGLFLCHYINTIRTFSDAKISFRAHNVEHEIWKRVADDTYNIFKKIYLRQQVRRLEELERSVINTYDYIVPITQRDADFFSSNGNTKPTIVVPAGMDIQAYNPVDFSAALYFIGSLDWIPNQQGLQWFIEECWPTLRNEFLQVTFHIAGRNAPLWLRKLCKKNGIVFVGEVESSVDFFNDKNIMIVPLFSGSGMRVKIIEGMHYGKIIISTSIGAEGIPVTNGENVLIGDNEEDFINAVRECLKDAAYMRRLGNAAHEFITKNYDNKILVGRLNDFYNENMR